MKHIMYTIVWLLLGMWYSSQFASQRTPSIYPELSQFNNGSDVRIQQRPVSQEFLALIDKIGDQSDAPLELRAHPEVIFKALEQAVFDLLKNQVASQEEELELVKMSDQLAKLYTHVNSLDSSSFDGVKKAHDKLEAFVLSLANNRAQLTKAQNLNSFKTPSTCEKPDKGFVDTLLNTTKKLILSDTYTQMRGSVYLIAFMFCPPAYIFLTMAVLNISKPNILDKAWVALCVMLALCTLER